MIYYMSNKKYNIVKTIENDAPFGDINWCSISFLTPQKIETAKYLDVIGFKVHNGYNTMEMANEDAKKIKENNQCHDVYLSQIGKIYAWDDATKTDSVEYDNERLNDLDKSRRENLEKAKLIREQYKNEYSNICLNANTDRNEAQRKRLQKKLYDKGLITTQEYEMMQEINKPSKEVKDITLVINKMNEEIDKCSEIDYLDENDGIGLKYGCISIYSPKKIGGLKMLCFKIRGLFQTEEEVRKRISKLKVLYPDDSIYHFEVGKWTGFSEKDLDQKILLKQLNYGMKCHKDNIEKEKEEFEKRKDTLQNQTEKEAQSVRRRNRRERKKDKKDKKNLKDVASEPAAEPVAALGLNPEDNNAIQKIVDYLEDPELHNKYSVDKSCMQTVEVDLNN